MYSVVVEIDLPQRSCGRSVRADLPERIEDRLHGLIDAVQVQIKGHQGVEVLNIWGHSAPLVVGEVQLLQSREVADAVRNHVDSHGAEPGRLDINLLDVARGGIARNEVRIAVLTPVRPGLLLG